MQQLLLTYTTLLIFFYCTKTLGQSPAQAPAAATAAAPPPGKAPAPARPRHHQPATSTGPPDTVNILLKAGHFTSFARLIRATHVDSQLLSQLNSSTDGITIFAPTDAAFANVKGGSIGSLDDKDKVEFVQFHILPRFLTLSDFQTMSNPVRTLAGSNSKFPLTITTTDNAVNISSGVTKTSISNTVYTDKMIAIYEVDTVLLPKNLFPPAPAAAPVKAAEAPVSVIPKDASGAGIGKVLHCEMVVFALGIGAAVMFFL